MAKPRSRRRRQTNPEWVKLRRLYDKDGTYDRILKYQGGVCGICGRPPGKRRLHLDHDHASLEIRGILCFPCNSILRKRITIQWLGNATVYLQRQGTIKRLVMNSSVNNNGENP